YRHAISTIRPPPRSKLFPYTTLFRSHHSVSSRCLKIPFIFGFRRRLRQRGFLREQSFRPRPKSSVPSLNIQLQLYAPRAKRVHPPFVPRRASLLTLPGTGAVASP